MAAAATTPVNGIAHCRSMRLQTANSALVICAMQKKWPVLSTLSASCVHSCSDSAADAAGASAHRINDQRSRSLPK